jgi:hypothetical protein
MAINVNERNILRHATGADLSEIVAMLDYVHDKKGFTGTAAGTIPVNRLVKGHTDGTLLVGTLGSLRVLGVNVGAAGASGGNVTVSHGYQTVVAAEPILAGDILKCGDNGRVLQLNDAAELNKEIAKDDGGDFGNQPADDIVQVVSGSAADTTQIVTLIGTTHGGVVTVTQTVALNGTTAVDSVKADWGIILAVKLSASCAGTVTIRKKTGPATITTLLTTVLSKGVIIVPAADQGAHGLVPYIKAGGASTKYAGVLYEPATGAADALMTAQLNGTTAVALPAAANLVKEIYVGDVAAASEAGAYVNATEDDEHARVAKAMENIATGASGTAFVCP